MNIGTFDTLVDEDKSVLPQTVRCDLKKLVLSVEENLQITRQKTE